MRQWSHFGRSDDGLSADLARQWTRPYYYGMTLITLTLATLPALVTLAVTAGRIVASLAREARIITVLWLALRGTRPDERAEIIRALAERSQRGLGNNDSASRLAAAGTRRRERGVHLFEGYQYLYLGLKRFVLGESVSFGAYGALRSVVSAGWGCADGADGGLPG